MITAFQIIAGAIRNGAEGLLDEDGVDEKEVRRLAKGIIRELAKNGIIHARAHKIVMGEIHEPVLVEPAFTKTPRKTFQGNRSSGANGGPAGRQRW
jgi:hypothetical protein